jgi:hypothetical protein
VKEEETFEINWANVLGHFVCEGSQGEGKEVRGSRNGEVIQVMRSG